LTLSLADTHRSYCCHHTGKQWPNVLAHTYEDIHTKMKAKKRVEKKEKNEKRAGKRKREGDGFRGVEERRYGRGQDLKPITLDRHEYFQFFFTCKRTNNANKATHYVKLGKKRRESFKRNYYIISARVVIKAIIIMFSLLTRCTWYGMRTSLE